MNLQEQIEQFVEKWQPSGITGHIQEYFKSELRTLLETAFKEQRELCVESTDQTAKAFDEVNIYSLPVLTSPDPETGL